MNKIYDFEKSSKIKDTIELTIEMEKALSALRELRIEVIQSAAKVIDVDILNDMIAEMENNINLLNNSIKEK